MEHDIDADEKSAEDEIQSANRILETVNEETSDDRHWDAVIRVASFVESHPEAVWQFVKRWGANSNPDVRDAIATCLLEHLLEFHFAAVFPKVEAEVNASQMFARTFCRCWKFGESNQKENSLRFDSLKQWCQESDSEPSDAFAG